jgi:hypothetical protein
MAVKMFTTKGEEERNMERKLVNFWIPVELARKFKAKVATEGTNMTHMVVEWIKKYVEEED